MKRKVVILSCLLITLVGIGFSTASAHVEVQLRGYSDKAGEESTIWMRIEHGCTFNDIMYPTHILQLTIPNTAGRPKPEYRYGFTATVIDSKTKDSKGVPTSYTVTWKSKSASFDIDGMNFAEFGLSTQWDKKPQTIYMPAVQTCYVDNDANKPLYLKWIVATGATPKDTSTTEYGPAPKITTTK
jgi:uncharacterized protein YcnI